MRDDRAVATALHVLARGGDLPPVTASGLAEGDVALSREGGHVDFLRRQLDVLTRGIERHGLPLS